MNQELRPVDPSQLRSRSFGGIAFWLSPTGELFNVRGEHWQWANAYLGGNEHDRAKGVHQEDALYAKGWKRGVGGFGGDSKILLSGTGGLTSAQRGAAEDIGMHFDFPVEYHRNTGDRWTAPEIVFEVPEMAFEAARLIARGYSSTALADLLCS